MKKFVLLVVLAWIMTVATGCGGGSDGTPNRVFLVQRGYVVDSPISGLNYECGDIVGVTNDEGMFECRELPVTFKIGKLIIGTASKMTSDKKFYPQDIVGKPRSDFQDEKVIKLTRFLQSLDDDGKIDRVIKITPKAIKTFTKKQNLSELSQSTIQTLVKKVGKTYVSKDEAIEHLKKSVEKLTSITITPSSATIALGETVNFTAKGSFANGVKRDITDKVVWSSSANAIATMNGAKAVSKSTGRTVIKATYKGVSKRAILTVTTSSRPATGATGGSGDMGGEIAMPTDTTKPTITLKGNKTVTIIVGDSYTDAGAIATDDRDGDITSKIQKSGNVDTNRVGTYTITYSVSDRAGNSATATRTVIVKPVTLSNIKINPLNITSIAKGKTAQLSAIGTYNNGTTKDITNQVAWSSITPDIATVSTQGVVTATNKGTAKIKATVETLNNEITILISDATLDSISITANKQEMPKGLTGQLKAIGTYSDGTTKDVTNQVAWSSSDTSKATINSTGVISALKDGNVTVTASISGLSATQSIKIVQVLTSMTIAPAEDIELVINKSAQLKVTGTYSDGETKDITNDVAWSSSSDVVYVSPDGLVSGFGIGTATVTATLGDKNISKSITVSDISYTEVSGQIREDTIWTLDKSPYKLTGKIQIAKDVTLTIEPGVRVYGNSNTIEVFGTLDVLGNDSKKVKLLNVNITNASGILTSKINIHYADIRGGKIGQQLTYTNGTMNIYDSKIKDISFNSYSYLIYNSGEGFKEHHIERNIFINIPKMTISNYNYYESSGVEDSKVIIKNNLFYNCKGIESYTLNISAAKTINVNYNSFINSPEFNLSVEDNGLMNTQNNYWGTTDETKIASMIWDNYDDLALNEISFKPYLTEPDPNTPTYDPSTDNSSLTAMISVTKRSEAKSIINGYYSAAYGIELSNSAQKAFQLKKLIITNGSGRVIKTVTNKTELNNGYLSPKKDFVTEIKVRGNSAYNQTLYAKYYFEEIETGEEFVYSFVLDN